MNSHPSEDMVVAYKEFRAGIFQAIEWDQAVRIYTLRSLTCPDDRLEALAGIATVAAEMWNSRYYAGLWEYDMARQLGWRVDKSAIFTTGNGANLEGLAGLGPLWMHLCAMSFSLSAQRRREELGSSRAKSHSLISKTRLAKFFLGVSP